MKIRMIYLAAGSGKRFGQNKLLWEIGGKPMYRYGLDALEQVLVAKPNTCLTVVSGQERIREDVLARKEKWGERICLTVPADSEKGISYSIRAGLGSGRADYYLFLVADQPGIRAETILRLLEEVVLAGCDGGFVEWEGESGNPAVFSAKFLPALWALEGDRGGKRLLLGRENICKVQAGSRQELWDIDEKKDVAEMGSVACPPGRAEGSGR